MISQRCPRCGSDRIRKGYRYTSFWSKLVFRFYLLCDKCNWEFKGFAIPFLKKKKKRKVDEKLESNGTSVDSTETSVDEAETEKSEYAEKA